LTIYQLPSLLMTNEDAGRRQQWIGSRARRNPVALALPRQVKLDAPTATLRCERDCFDQLDGLVVASVDTHADWPSSASGIAFGLQQALSQCVDKNELTEPGQPSLPDKVFSLTVDLLCIADDEDPYEGSQNISSQGSSDCHLYYESMHKFVAPSKRPRRSSSAAGCHD
jgi:hypothetical protein